MIERRERLLYILLLFCLAACFPAENEPQLPTPTHLTTTAQPPATAIPPTPRSSNTPAPSPVPTQTAVPLATMPPTATPESSFSETAVFGEPVAQKLLPLSDGRFAIQTVQGIAIYHESDLANVAQYIPVPVPGWSLVDLSTTAAHIVWRNENGRLFVQRLADEAILDEAILLEVPGNPNGWDHPSFHLSPQGNFGWLYDGEAYSDELPVVTLYHLQDGAELVQFRGNLPQFSSDDAFFVRDTREGLLVYETARPTEPLYTVPHDPEVSFWSIDLTADLLQLTVYPQTVERPFVDLRDVATGELLHTHFLADDETRVTPSPDGQSLAVTFKQDDGADSPTVVAAGVRLYTVTGELRHEFLAPQISPVPAPSACDGVWTSRRSDPVYALINVDFAADGRSLNVTYSDYVATPVTHLYATDSGEKLAEFAGHESLFVANGRTFISLSTDGLVQQWDTATPDATPQTIARYGTPITDLTLSNDGELAALVNEIGVELRHTADGELMQQYAAATAVTFAPDDETIVLGFVDGRIQWRNLADDSLLSEMSDHAAPIRRLALWPNQPEPTVLALAENDCRITRWQLTTGRQLAPLNTILTFAEYGDVIQMSIDDFALVPTGNLLAGRSWFMYGFGVWDLSNDNNILTELEDQPLGVRDLAFSADGRLLATGETWPPGGWVGPEQGGLRLWQIDVDDVSLRWSTELDQFVGAVAFSNNSSLLAVGYSSGGVTLVSTHLEQFVGRLETVGGVTGLAFGANGRWLAATTRDGLTHIWQIDSP